MEECALGTKWDGSDEVCSCVEIDCPDVVCGENYVFDEECNCQCGIDASACQPYENFNADDCTCYTHMGCDFIEVCPLGEKWDRSDDVCDCVPIECDKESCSENYAFDENCDCQCAITQEFCDTNHQGSQLLNCECIWYDPCIEEKCLIPGEKWSFDACICVKDPDYKITTECIQKHCNNRYVWVQEMCDCVCPPYHCDEGTIHGDDCDCVTDPNYCWPLECSDNQYFDKESCSCLCSLTDESCTGLRSFLDSSNCECRHRPCDPVRPCVEGEILDIEKCGCVLDPSYSTTCQPSSTRKPRKTRGPKTKSRAHDGSSESKGSGGKHENYRSSERKGSSESEESDKKHGSGEKVKNADAKVNNEKSAEPKANIEKKSFTKDKKNPK